MKPRKDRRRTPSNLFLHFELPNGADLKASLLFEAFYKNGGKVHFRKGNAMRKEDRLKLTRFLEEKGFFFAGDTLYYRESDYFHTKFFIDSLMQFSRLEYRKNPVMPKPKTEKKPGHN